MSYLLKLKGRNAKGYCNPIFYLNQCITEIVIPNLNTIQFLAVKLNSIGCMLVESTCNNNDNELIFHVIEKENYKPHDINDFVPLVGSFKITKSDCKPASFKMINNFLDKSIDIINEYIIYRIA